MRNFSFSIPSDNHAVCALYSCGKLVVCESDSEEHEPEWEAGEPTPAAQSRTWAIHRAISSWHGHKALEAIVHAAILEIDITYWSDDEPEQTLRKALEGYLRPKE